MLLIMVAIREAAVVVLLVWCCLAGLSLSFSALPGGTRRTRSVPVLLRSKNEERQTLGLLTFDLDDTLYPIAVVEEEANKAFVKAMATYGFENLKPNDIVETAQKIRDEMNEVDPASAAALTHSELRLLAIRREMEKCTVERKLQACAEDWATTVTALSPLVVENAKKWAAEGVNENVVRAVSTAWEMERHHSAERHLYPEVIDVLKQIKREHPTAIVGAVTDGRSNPLFMTFTLAPFFDFRCSWEDDQAKRREFFQKLEGTQGIQQLSWIYDEARYYYSVLKKAADGMKSTVRSTEAPLSYPETYDDRAWIHVGDDLAFDVGGSAACGAKTIYCELEDTRYGQTARHRYDVDASKLPSWSTTPEKELKARNEMAKAAEEKVDVRLKYLSLLPDAINDILQASAE